MRTSGTKDGRGDRIGEGTSPSISKSPDVTYFRVRFGVGYRLTGNPTFESPPRVEWLAARLIGLFLGVLFHAARRC